MKWENYRDRGSWPLTGTVVCSFHVFPVSFDRGCHPERQTV